MKHGIKLLADRNYLESFSVCALGGYTLNGGDLSKSRLFIVEDGKFIPKGAKLIGISRDVSSIVANETEELYPLDMVNILVYKSKEDYYLYID